MSDTLSPGDLDGDGKTTLNDWLLLAQRLLVLVASLSAAVASGWTAMRPEACPAPAPVAAPAPAPEAPPAPADTDPNPPAHAG